MSSFQKLAPANQQEEASPSSSLQFVPEGASSKARVDSSSGDAGGATSQDAGGDDSHDNGGDRRQTRKRRAPGSVSQMACNPCRQARQRVSIQKIRYSGTANFEFSFALIMACFTQCVNRLTHACWIFY